MLEEYAREFPATKIIGSGGNINRLIRLASLKGPQRELPVERLHELYDPSKRSPSLSEWSSSYSRRTVPT